MTARERSGFSLRTADATDGGGIEGALATITEIEFVSKFTYGGRQKDKPQAALRVEYKIEGFDKPWEQHHTVGPTEKYEVVADGDGIKALGKQTGLNKKSSAFAFFNAVETAAEQAHLDLDELLPEIDDENVHSIRPLEGRQVRLTNIKFETVGGDTKDLPVIASFETKEQSARGNGKSSASRGAGGVETKTEEAVKALLEAQTSVKKGDLSDLVYQENKKDKDVRAMMQLCFKESWLSDEARPWSYDKKKGILREAD